NAVLLYLLVTWCVNFFYLHLPEEARPYQPLYKRPLMHYGIAALLVGAQFMAIGLLAELMTAYSGREEDTYSIAEHTAPARPRPPSAPHTALPAGSQAPHHAPRAPRPAAGRRRPDHLRRWPGSGPDHRLVVPPRAERPQGRPEITHTPAGLARESSR